eukprot:scaffold141_cov123-Isochrysis_galbana.AAC.2
MSIYYTRHDTTIRHSGCLPWYTCVVRFVYVYVYVYNRIGIVKKHKLYDVRMYACSYIVCRGMGGRADEGREGGVVGLSPFPRAQRRNRATKPRVRVPSQTPQNIIT